VSPEFLRENAVKIPDDPALPVGRDAAAQLPGALDAPGDPAAAVGRPGVDELVEGLNEVIVGDPVAVGLDPAPEARQRNDRKRANQLNIHFSSLKHTSAARILSRPR
jgi:hypothetical protein